MTAAQGHLYRDSSYVVLVMELVEHAHARDLTLKLNAFYEMLEICSEYMVLFIRAGMSLIAHWSHWQFHCNIK